MSRFLVPRSNAGYTRYKGNLMKKDRSGYILTFLVILAIVFSVGFAVLLVRQEMERRRSDIEFQVYQIMTGLVDVYDSGGEIDASALPQLSGFGIYSEGGIALYRQGSAPITLEDIESVSARGYSILAGSSMKILRRSGPVSLMFGMNSSPGRRGIDQPMRMGQGRFRPPGGVPDGSMDLMMNKNHENRFVFIDINVENLLREGQLVLYAVIALLSVFIGIVSLVLVYSRKLAMYRERERRTTHLVQLGEAARTLAHEIKNPLGIIRVQCATLKRTIGEDRQSNVSVIEQETERIVLLTDRVKDFLRASDGNPLVYEASYFLDQSRVRYAESITVEPLTGRAVHVLVDAARMTQVLDNLIANALESGDAISKPCLSLSVSRKAVLFTVADRGAGVASQNRERLFEPFFTTKANGSGIGLALSRRFMEQAGGSLIYEERPGGGSWFIASLPLVKKRGNST